MGELEEIQDKPIVNCDKSGRNPYIGPVMSKKPAPLSVTLWLLLCCAMIFVMALVGAITRLTESGLSITDWKPLTGALPPLNEQAWLAEFNAYKQIPQYQILNRGMSLDEFKGIFFWEWLHRLWGRLIGFVFAVPLLVFFLRKQLSRATGLKFLMIFALGGLQGFIGWFMVQSGLSVRTSVSPYRLALHLDFALMIYALLLWAVFDGLAQVRASPFPRHLRAHGWSALVLLAVTMTWGAFTAGMHAGEVYNTWPLMEGDLLPTAATTLRPAWQNILGNAAFVQFTHRWLGPTTMFVLLSWIYRCWPLTPPANRRGLVALGAMAIFQVSLGITTLLSHAEIAIAVTHQAGAITLLSLLLFELHKRGGTTR